MITVPPPLLKTKFDLAVPYAQFVAMGEPAGHRPPWDQRYEQLQLSPEQHALIAGFTRKINILCLTGTWCGDCALQGSALQRIAEANPDHIDLRFILREDAHADIIVKSQINAGFRVPVSWFMAEDFEPVFAFGDRTLSRYRSMARKMLGDDYVQAPAPTDPVATVLQEMIDTIERVHLLLRLSGRFREKYND